MFRKLFLALGLFLAFTSCTTVTTISDIQGTSHRSQYENKEVKNISGVVTAIYKTKFNNGFFMQSKKFDNNKVTSEGIYVENKSKNEIKIGDLVKVAGIVKEIQLTKPNQNELTITSIQATNVEIIEENVTVKPVLLNASKIPFIIHDESNVDKLDINKNAMDFYEAHEGMLIKIKDPVVVGLKEKYGEIAIIPENGKYTKNRTNNGGIKYTYDNEQTQKLLVSDKFISIKKDSNLIDPNFTPNPGDKFLGEIEGILSFDYNNYKIYNTKPLPKLMDMNTKRDTNKFKYDEDRLSVVSYNIENFTIADGMDRVKDLANQVNTVLNKADIIGLIEVGDDDGGSKKSDPNVLSADKTLTAIVNEIEKVTGIKYGYLTVNPEDKKDGGWPEMHIRNAVLYRKDRVQVPYIREGKSNEDTKIENGNLIYNPGRIGTNSKDFEEVRKSLVTHLKFEGKDVFVVANHLKSKRSDDKLYGLKRPVVRRSEEKRIPEGKIIGEFLKELTIKFPEAVVISLGDMNDFEFSKTMQAMKTDAMVSVVELLPENERHTYVYEGNSQVLDNILVNKKYEENINIDILNINSEFTNAQGYFSDHDPIYIQIKVK